MIVHVDENSIEGLTGCSWEHMGTLLASYDCHEANHYRLA